MKTLADYRDAIDAELAEDAKSRASKIRVNGAKAYLRDAIKEGLFEGEVKEAISAVAGGLGNGGSSRPSPRMAVLATLIEKGSMTNIECFTEFDKGPSEMRDLMRFAVKSVAPADRVWITFEDKMYNVVATGEEVPEGWVGYMPTTEEDEEL